MKSTMAFLVQTASMEERWETCTKFWSENL